MRGQITEVPINNIELKHSAVKTHLIQTLAWRERKAKFIAEATDGVMEDVLLRILPLLGADRLAIF